MQYSEHSHETYVVDGKGPGSSYVGDLERWNWRWLLVGTDHNESFDAGVLAFFNDSQRRLMQMAPVDAIYHMETFMSDDLTEAVRQRANEAQSRLYPQKIVAREGNVIVGNFGKRK